MNNDDCETVESHYIQGILAVLSCFHSLPIHSFISKVQEPSVPPVFSMTTSKAEIVAVAAAKWVRQLIEEYDGPPEGLRGYLLRELARRDKHANRIMANIIDDLL